ncbi:hypothetical protein BGX29_006273 [Mortierella sp. GBA35]|nr:hypothetical protein BGX29_006273 [Mortierella sp. GBA35]
MRILSLSLGLAAVALVAAQAADPMAATGTQNAYEWAPAPGDKDLAAQIEDLSIQVSELEFRAELLSRLEEEEGPAKAADFKAEGACDGVTDLIQTALQSINGILSGLIVVPFVGTVVQSIQRTIAHLATMPANLSLAFEALVSVLKSILSVGPLKDVAAPLIDALSSLQGSVALMAQCALGGRKMTIESSSCYSLADLYRGVIEDAAGMNPALNLPADASEDLRRLATGSLTILDLISKNSIAATSEALLTSRPIFAADILDQYRAELIRSTTDDEIKGYAVSSLGTVVGISNALEARLRVAADPIAAIDELKEELEAQAYYDDEDEDEDEE